MYFKRDQKCPALKKCSMKTGVTHSDITTKQNKTRSKDFMNHEIKTIDGSYRALPRMRVAKECYRMIHDADPQSRISERYIRILAKSGTIPTVQVGNRLLVNYDSLLEFLANPKPTVQQTGIRPIKER